jgi:Methylglyoxal synthase
MIRKRVALMAHDHKKNDLNTFTAACPLLQPVSAEFFFHWRCLRNSDRKLPY